MEQFLRRYPESIKTDSKYFDPVIDKTDSLIRKPLYPTGN